MDTVRKLQRGGIKQCPLCTLMQILNKILENTSKLNSDRILYIMMK